ncbi:alpha/beta fold hydrolase [Saccharopolyspora sp. MS10]|uniref:alpha/beta fold hydrolase n=1 Tax=Saccharopolyspora sp. MS10 TaxID=3385973 RepID=UPI00399F8BE9
MNPLPPLSPSVGPVSPLPRRSRRFLLLIVIVVLLIAGLAALWSGERPVPGPPAPRQAQIDVQDGPNGRERIQIDATLYSPAATPAPAIVIAHGLGGDKTSAADQAQELARRGFTVLTYSARGFGRSSGRIALNAVEYEVADAQQVVSWLARQPEVQRDGDGDPRVGVTGESYGGALSLLLAGHDPRVDAIAPVMTYNDLGQALLPNSADSAPPPAATPAQGTFAPQGVFRRAWAGLMFAAGEPSPAGGAGAGGTAPPVTCGNFTAEVCAAYGELARTGRASPATRALLASVSPSTVTDEIRIPTLLAQGEQDSLFGLDQADANARQIAAAGGDVSVLWFAGGHDGDGPGSRVESRIADWFAFHLGLPDAPPPGARFEYDIAGTRRADGEVPVRTVAAPDYPGVRADRTPRFALDLTGDPTTVVNPPGGSPAAVSSVPGDADRRSRPQDLPGQVAVFRTEPMSSRMLVSGVPRTRLSIAAVPGQPSNGDAVLFAKLYDVDREGRRELVGDSVAPLHVTGLRPDGTPREVNVALPGVVHSIESGHHLELAVSTTDQAYAVPVEPGVHRVAVTGDRALSVPSVKGASTTGGAFPAAPVAGILAVLALGGLAWLVARLRTRYAASPEAEAPGPPLAIEGLTKVYPRKVTALNGISLRVERGQIVGLLGPNGAGKTTTLRLLLGLLHPSSGEIRVFGHRVAPGAPVLSRIGALVESPGFPPHLTGLESLKHHWAATGKPVLQARFDEVLQIAGLGEHAHRRTATYSQGTQQRLAIAQAMLGLPDLLVLDEPTNRLDPPQIHQMREILRRYAATGRSVLLCSHLLSEVEQTCTHVIVMHRGEVVTTGSVEEVVSLDGQATFRVDAPERAAEALRALEGLGDVQVEGDLVHADLAGHSRSIAVNALVASGVAVSQVGPRRRLEDAFLNLVGEEQR